MRLYRKLSRSPSSPPFRIDYGGQFEEQQKSFGSFLKVFLLALLCSSRCIVRIPTFSAPIAILASRFFPPLGDSRRFSLRDDIQRRFVHGMIMVIASSQRTASCFSTPEAHFRESGMSSHDAMIQAGRRPSSPHRDDCSCHRRGMLPLAFGLGAGSQMLQPLAISVIGAFSAQWSFRWYSRQQSITSWDILWQPGRAAR